MSEPDDVIDTRYANGLSKQGLWVGGKVVLTASHLSFKPNKLNAVFQASVDRSGWSASLRDAVAVRLRRGFITDIIEIELPSRSVSLRCFRASAFAGLIERSRISAQPPLATSLAV